MILSVRRRRRCDDKTTSECLTWTGTFSPPARRYRTHLDVHTRSYTLDATALHGKPISELRSVTCHIGSQCCLPADTGERAPATPAMQAGTRFTYPGGMEGWVDLGVGYIPRWFTCPQTVTHPGTNHLIATCPGVESTSSRSQVQRPNHYTTKPPKHPKTWPLHNDQIIASK